MFPNMAGSSFSSADMMNQAVPNSSSMKDHRHQLHLHNLTHSSNNNGGAGHSFSTRLPSSGSSPTSSESSSAFLNSPSSNQVNNSSSTTSFKFSLLNTVRKAFKKNSLSEQGAKDNMGSQGNLSKIPAGSSKATASTTTMMPQSPQSQSPPFSTTHFENEQAVLKAQQGRIRSSTYDSTSTTTPATAFKQQFKQLHQDALPRQNENPVNNNGHKLAGRKLFKSEKVRLAYNFFIFAFNLYSFLNCIHLFSF